MAATPTPVHQTRSMWDFLAQFLLDITIGDWIRDRMGRRRSARGRSKGRVKCGLRVESGTQDGLSRRWRQGRAHVSSGRLLFKGRVISLMSVDATWSRKLTFWESLWMDPQCRLLRLTTPTARLECAVSEHDAAWVADKAAAASRPAM